ncbi:hypothetical protein MKK82_32370 [Methylobacterium sp. E-046]|nr:hypothetical protein [Methylobacterium sp. E-046]MCJ2103513.1 hypothetical protein [Methylobacterium sp. E-046]
MSNMNIGALALAIGLVTPALAEPPAMGGPRMLIHGNYCGPGNNAPSPPIDMLDAACARHDACTPNGRVPSRTCNARLEQEADAISRDTRQPADLRAMAGFVAAGAAMLQIADGPTAISIVTSNIANR